MSCGARRSIVSAVAGNKIQYTTYDPNTCNISSSHLTYTSLRDSFPSVLIFPPVQSRLEMCTSLSDLDHPEYLSIVCGPDSLLGQRTGPAHFPVPCFMYTFLFFILTLSFLYFPPRCLHSPSLYDTLFLPYLDCLPFFHFSLGQYLTCYLALGTSLSLVRICLGS